MRIDPERRKAFGTGEPGGADVGVASMRWLSAGSIVGLAQAVLINAIDVHRGVLLRAGLELAEEQPTPSVHPDRAEQPQQMPPMPQMPQMLPPIDPRKKQAIRSMPEVGADAPAAVLSPYRLKPMDSSSDSDGIRSDYSMSEVTADSEVTSSELASDEYVPQADSVPHACLEVDRVDLGKVDAMKLVMESTRAVAVGRVLPFEQFSAAVRNLLYIVDALLMDMRKAHQFISGDIVNNLRKVEKAMQSTNTECMEEMVLTEVQMGVKYKNSGREALLWLKRTLVFIYTCSTFAAERDCALVKSVKDAYNVCLAPCHGFRAHAIRFMMSGIPERSVFLSRLGQEEDQVVEEMKIWLRDLRPILAHLCNFCTNNKLERLDKCRNIPI